MPEARIIGYDETVFPTGPNAGKEAIAVSVLLPGGATRTKRYLKEEFDLNAAIKEMQKEFSTFGKVVGRTFDVY